MGPQKGFPTSPLRRSPKFRRQVLGQAHHAFSPGGGTRNKAASKKALETGGHAGRLARPDVAGPRIVLICNRLGRRVLFCGGRGHLGAPTVHRQSGLLYFHASSRRPSEAAIPEILRKLAKHVHFDFTAKSQVAPAMLGTRCAARPPPPLRFPPEKKRHLQEEAQAHAEYCGGNNNTDDCATGTGIGTCHRGTKTRRRATAGPGTMQRRTTVQSRARAPGTAQAFA